MKKRLKVEIYNAPGYRRAWVELPFKGVHKGSQVAASQSFQYTRDGAGHWANKTIEIFMPGMRFRDVAQVEAVTEAAGLIVEQVRAWEKEGE